MLWNIFGGNVDIPLSKKNLQFRKHFLDKIPLFSHFKMSRTLERTVFVEEI